MPPPYPGLIEPNRGVSVTVLCKHERYVVAMAREMTDQEHEELADRLHAHMLQVEAGLIPADAPPTFVRPEGDNALDERGLPWFYGPDFHVPKSATS